MLRNPVGIGMRMLNSFSEIGDDAAQEGATIKFIKGPETKDLLIELDMEGAWNLHETTYEGPYARQMNIRLSNGTYAWYD